MVSILKQKDMVESKLLWALNAINVVRVIYRDAKVGIIYLFGIIEYKIISF